MTTGVRARVYNLNVVTFVYLVIGAVVAVMQDYWDVTSWDDHVVAHLLTALVATLLWPISLFYTFALFPR
jgi:hypothetical protein